MTTHMVTVRDARLAVHTRGAGIPCVLLHGFPLDHAMWREQEPLAEHLRLIVPDLRGFGGSAATVLVSIVSIADDVPALLDALHVGGPAVICGLSMGGYVAQHVAVRHPDRVAALVLVDTKLEADTPEARAARVDLSAKVGRLGQAIVAEAMVPRLLAPAAAGTPGRGALEDLLRGAIHRQTVAGIQAALAARLSSPRGRVGPRGVSPRCPVPVPQRPWPQRSDSVLPEIVRVSTQPSGPESSRRSASRPMALVSKR